ncbi:MAG: hypothetical protein AC479_05970 [miscellaneous Crenarchaeota group-6 archaeon AD8-1]|nr:MAG: hypothetical protein AC479_05970 [miscellaneous Crenarchaeota group-6 archaeon AD8-1]
MSVEIVLSVIAIIGSVIVALITHFSTKKNQESITLLNSKLEEKKAEKDARRDYLYDARKRLYEECEPLFFLLNEMSERAIHRVYSLARTARKGNLGKSSGWLSSRGYYFKSTLYNMISPLTIFKLMQKRLTLVDLSVDPNVKTRYELIKYVYLSFTNDYTMAGVEPKIEYDPNSRNSEKIEQNPTKYWPQGIYAGRLDNAIESLIIEGSDKSDNLSRCMSYGEFENELMKKGSKVQEAFYTVGELFLNFHPKTRPVLWRILIVQIHLYLALARACEAKESNITTFLKPLKLTPKDKRDEFDWRSSENEASEEEVFVEPFEVAKKYYEQRLRQYLA